MDERLQWAFARAYGTRPHGTAVRNLLAAISRRRP